MSERETCAECGRYGAADAYTIRGDKPFCWRCSNSTFAMEPSCALTPKPPELTPSEREELENLRERSKHHTRELARLSALDGDRFESAVGVQRQRANSLADRCGTLDEDLTQTARELHDCRRECAALRAKMAGRR